MKILMAIKVIGNQIASFGTVIKEEASTVGPWDKN